MQNTRLLLFFVFVFSFCYVFGNQGKPIKTTAEVTSQPKQIIPTKLKKTPVVIFNDTLFHIYGNIGSFNSKQRAKSIEEKIVAISDSYAFDEDLIQLVDTGIFLSVTYNDEIVMSIDSLQAVQENKTKIEAGEYYRQKIINAIEWHKSNTSWQRKLFQIVGTVLIIIIEILIFKLIKYTYRRLRVLFWLQRGKKIKGLFGVIDDQRAVYTGISVLNGVRYLITTVFLYLGLTSIFKLFPYTKHLSDRLISYVLSPLKTVAYSIEDYLPKLFTIIVIIILFRYIRKLLRSLAEKLATNKITVKGFYPDWAFPTYNLISGLLFIFMFILIFPYLPHADSQIFQGVSVFAGIMLSLGSTSVIGNLVAGFVITYMRPFRIGDRIKLGEYTGDVLEKTPLVTRIKTPKNEIVTIPNSNIMSAHTVNYTQSAKEHGLILYITIAVGYEVPWQKVHEMLYEVARRTEHVLKRHKPFILQDQFGDFDVDYQLNVYIRDAKLTAKIYSDLRQHTQDVFAENNIELVSVHQNMNRNVNGYDYTTIPQKDS